jgi:hypothetical protein
MRKSERIRLLEMQMVRLEMLVELYGQSLSNLLESQEMDLSSNIDSGKWYTKRND